jgi:hypothetical protein
VQLLRRQRLESLLGDWTENDRLALARLIGQFNHELSRDAG